jgi:hypothetical protein
MYLDDMVTLDEDELIDLWDDGAELSDIQSDEENVPSKKPRNTQSRINNDGSLRAPNPGEIAPDVNSNQVSALIPFSYNRVSIIVYWYLDRYVMYFVGCRW